MQHATDRAPGTTIYSASLVIAVAKTPAERSALAGVHRELLGAAAGATTVCAVAAVAVTVSAQLVQLGAAIGALNDMSAFQILRRTRMHGCTTHEMCGNPARVLACLKHGSACRHWHEEEARMVVCVMSGCGGDWRRRCCARRAHLQELLLGLDASGDGGVLQRPLHHLPQRGNRGAAVRFVAERAQVLHAVVNVGAAEGLQQGQHLTVCAAGGSAVGLLGHELPLPPG